MNSLEQLNRLKVFMDIYIQLMFQSYEAGGTKLCKAQLPTFKYFCDTYDDERYSMVQMNYKEVKDLKVENDKLVQVVIHTRGLGTEDHVAYRYYNYWIGGSIYYLNNQFQFNMKNTEELLKQLIK
jgi:hypothetical protein